MAQGKFIAYYRVSTDRQGQSGLGLDAQKKTVRDYLNGGDWRLVSEVTETESGKNNDRPHLMQALRLCRLHQATLIVANTSRLTRNYDFMDLMADTDVEVVFCDSPKLDGPAGRFMRRSLANAAAFEADLISERTKKALAEAKARGVKLGKPENLTNGDKGRMKGLATRLKKVFRRARDVEPIIAELRQSGVTSLRGIAKELDSREIPAPKGGSWSATQVRRMLATLDQLPKEPTK